MAQAWNPWEVEAGGHFQVIQGVPEQAGILVVLSPKTTQTNKTHPEIKSKSIGNVNRINHFLQCFLKITPDGRTEVL